MGIKSLMKLLTKEAPRAIQEKSLTELMGRRIAIDASMAIYAFLVAVRQASQAGRPGVNLMNADGEVTSHIQGMLSRTVRLMEHGIKPVYVFDGKAPTLKSGELAKRKDAKEKAAVDLEAAEKRLAEEGKDATEEERAKMIEEIEKRSKRTVHMNRGHQEDVKRLLRLMGVPVVEAPCEAEAQCAELAKAGVVWAAATEDMDTLCFGTPRLLRHLTFSEARKEPILQINLEAVLEDLKLTMTEFIDVCILCGCDYLEPLKGIGPTKAFARIKAHGTLAKVVEGLRIEAKAAAEARRAGRKPKGGSIIVPDEYPIEEAQRLFVEADVADPHEVSKTIKWRAPDEDGLIKFLVDEKSFDRKRVEAAIARLKKARSKGSQKRLDGFFGGGGGKKKAKDKLRDRPAKRPASESEAPATDGAAKRTRMIIEDDDD